jgi:hypothetical protein
MVAAELGNRQSQKRPPGVVPGRLFHSPLGAGQGPLRREWAEKPLDSMLTIPAELHDAVMALSPEDRRDRAKVNEAARQAEQSGDR